MKKNKTKDQEQKRKPRRLSLNRETIQILDDPALLEPARGGTEVVSEFEMGCHPRTSSIDDPNVCQ